MPFNGNFFYKGYCVSGSNLRKVGVPMKKRVVGRRVLSILLCMLMVLCTVPMFAFAAADGAGITVLERSDPLLYVYRNITEARQPEKVKTGHPLSDYPLSSSGAVLRFATETGAWGQSYPNAALAAEWINPDKIYDEAGSYTEPVKIYVIADSTIWAKVEYTFTVEQGSTIQPAEIETMPVIGSPVKYVEGIKVSDLTMDGGKANVEGAFAFTEPDKALFVGTNQVSVTFTPDDPTQAEAVTFTIPVTVEKGDIVVKEAPTFTFVYENTPLKNRSVLHNAVIEGGVIEPSAVTWDWYDKGGLKVKDPQANLALGVGNYQIVARATAQDGRNFNIGFCTVNVVIKADETKAFPLQADLEGNELHIKAHPAYYGGKGTVTYSVNGTVVAENADPTVEVVYAIPESGDYTVKAEYTPAENDNYIYKPATQTVKAILPRTVTVNGGSGSGSYKPGDTVRVAFDQASLKKYYEFKGWKITNAEGETVDVGVSDLTQTSISFTMPDEDVTVEATSSFSIQLFFKSIGEMIMNFLMKVVEWIMGLFNGLGSLS